MHINIKKILATSLVLALVFSFFQSYFCLWEFKVYEKKDGNISGERIIKLPVKQDYLVKIWGSRFDENVLLNDKKLIPYSRRERNDRKEIYYIAPYDVVKVGENKLYVKTKGTCSARIRNCIGFESGFILAFPSTALLRGGESFYLRFIKFFIFLFLIFIIFSFFCDWFFYFWFCLRFKDIYKIYYLSFFPFFIFLFNFFILGFFFSFRLLIVFETFLGLMTASLIFSLLFIFCLILIVEKRSIQIPYPTLFYIKSLFMRIGSRVFHFLFFIISFAPKASLNFNNKKIKSCIRRDKGLENYSRFLEKWKVPEVNIPRIKLSSFSIKNSKGYALFLLVKRKDLSDKFLIFSLLLLVFSLAFHFYKIERISEQIINIWYFIFGLGITIKMIRFFNENEK